MKLDCVECRGTGSSPLFGGRCLAVALRGTARKGSSRWPSLDGFHLEENWLGSGFCSRACVEAVLLPSTSDAHRKRLEPLLNTFDVQERLKRFP